MAGRRLAAWDDFCLIVIQPVVEAGSKPGATCFAASRLGVVVHGGCPQVVVLQVMLHPVGEISAICPRPGRRSKERALPRHANWSESAKKNLATKLREERIKKAYRRRGMSTGVRRLAKLPLCGELAVREIIHHMSHLVMRHLLGAHPTRIELAAHLTDQMRVALKREHPAHHEGGQQVGPSQALRLDHYPESGDGGGSSRR